MSRPHATVIPLELASAGMVLAEALLDAHGAMLLPQGSTLSESSLASLRRRAIASCSVVAAAAAADPEQLARARAARLERLNRLFRHAAAPDVQADAGAALLRLLVTYREQQS
jgi:hypothetical protein